MVTPVKLTNGALYFSFTISGSVNGQMINYDRRYVRKDWGSRGVVDGIIYLISCCFGLLNYEKNFFVVFLFISVLSNLFL